MDQGYYSPQVSSGRERAGCVEVRAGSSPTARNENNAPAWQPAPATARSTAINIIFDKAAVQDVVPSDGSPYGEHGDAQGACGSDRPSPGAFGSSNSRD